MNLTLPRRVDDCLRDLVGLDIFHKIVRSLQVTKDATTVVKMATSQGTALIQENKKEVVTIRHQSTYRAFAYIE